MTDLETFIHDSDNIIFRMYKYKRLYTPYEIDQKFSDESIFENGNYPIYVMIKQAIELPDGDVLLKLLEVKPIYDRTEDYLESSDIYLYERLSDIVLEEHIKDYEEE